VDWTNLRMEITIESQQTTGAWQDRRLQEQDALDQLDEKIKSLAEDIQVTPDTTAGDIMESNDPVGLRLQDGLSRWNIEETRYFSGGGVEIVGVLDLQTWLQPALLSLASAAAASDTPETVTGLVIDARGLSFDPCVAPRVATPDGQILMQAQSLPPDTIKSRSPVVYVRDPADPMAAERSGESPIFVRATSVGATGALILETQSAGEIATHPDLVGIVSQGRVVIILEP